jgi:hypothetical protein
MHGNKRNNRVLLGVCPLKNDEKNAEGKLSRKDTHAVAATGVAQRIGVC